MFLCTGNSCRSQMAEGFARELGKGRIVPYSAGILAAGVHPRAIAVMRESGVDISRQRSKTIDWELLGKMDVIITLCANALESCPVTPKAIRRYHWPIKDPVGASGTEDEIMTEFRRAREDIRERLVQFLRDLDA
jgi:arsenate reductase